MSWPLVEFDKLGIIVTGSTPSRSNPEYFGRDIPFITPAELGRNIYVTGSKEYLSQKGAAKARILPRGAVMVCCIGSLGKTSIAGTTCTTNQQINSIIVDENLADSLYVYYYCLTIEKELINSAPATTIAIINKSNFSKLKIPLPPVHIQKKISALLYQANILCQQSTYMQTELNALAKAIFLDMFEDPVTNPKNWCTKKLGELVISFQGGKSLVASEFQENSGKNRVLKISSVTWGEFNSEESKPLPDDYTPPVGHFVRSGDLLFSRANTTELVGATALVFDTPNNLVLPDKLWRFVWKDYTLVSQVFFWQLLNTPSMRIQLGKISSGSGGSMKNIPKSKLNQLEVIYPPFQLQQEFEKIFLNIRMQKILVSKQLKDQNMMFQHLMQCAFSDKLDLENVA